MVYYKYKKEKLEEKFLESKILLIKIRECIARNIDEDDDISIREEIKFMNKNNRILIVFGVIFVIGMIVLMKSIGLGDNEMMKIMSDHGGNMDTSNYLVYLEQSIKKYQLIGLILSILGVFGIVKSIKIK